MGFVTIYRTCRKCKGDGVFDAPTYENGELVGTTPTPCDMCSESGKVVDTFIDGAEFSKIERLVKRILHHLNLPED